MKTILTIFSVVIASTTVAVAGNRDRAADLRLGTKFVVQQDIEFKGQSTLVWLQKGNVIYPSDSDALDVHGVYCGVSVFDYNPETRSVPPVLAGQVFELEGFYDSFIKTQVSFDLVSKSDDPSEKPRSLEITCRKGNLSVLDTLDIAHWEVFERLSRPLKVGNVRKSLGSMIKVVE